jgi:hypothetical protein
MENNEINMNQNNKILENNSIVPQEEKERLDYLVIYPKH